jgi:hypothetical protein
VAVVKGLTIKVLPAIMYGCEIWAIKWLDEVLLGEQSPFVHPRYNIVLGFLKQYLGLPMRSFGAAVVKLCNM